jgi:DNA-binding IclR family transcriptional regulator
MPDATAVRSLVGPFAWVVFEDMASNSLGDESAVVVASVRSIAARLAMSKDTVARAIARLIEAGLVERRVDRDPTSGRFGTASYLLHLDLAGVALSADRAADLRSAAGAPRPAARRRRGDLGQLSFLDEEAG